jgi:hypothetical protein
MGRIFAGRFGSVPMDAGNTAHTAFRSTRRAGATPKPGGPGPQRGPKRGVAPALLTYLPASTFALPVSHAILSSRLTGSDAENRKESRKENRFQSGFSTLVVSLPTASELQAENDLHVRSGWGRAIVVDPGAIKSVPSEP